MKHPAIVIAEGYFKLPNGKGAHGLVRGTERFSVLSVIDRACAGQDAGVALDGKYRGIPIVDSMAAALSTGSQKATHAVIGVATHGGRLTAPLKQLVLEAIDAGLNIVNGLHDATSEEPEISKAADKAGIELTDLRKPKHKSELHFWHGEIVNVKTPRLAVLGTDCALGKRTTTRLLVQALNDAGTQAEMIYTGQTGWMQGARYGFVLDSVVNDFVSGELEHAIVSCEREVGPDIMLIEGQSSLRNPSGPCGAEFLMSGGARGVVLQHAIGREFFEGYEDLGFRIPPIEDEISLIAHYGARTLAITVNGEHVSPEQAHTERQELESRLNLPVVDPVHQDVSVLVPVIQRFIKDETDS